jgi:hypothetical protein
MNQYTYDFEVQMMSTMLINAFSDIIINRFDVNKNVRNRIKTRVVYAPKDRILNDLLNRDQNLQLPVMSVNIGGITRDENRVFNKILGTYFTPPNASHSVHERGVLPVDITYNVSIMTRYQQDMDQILSHMLPYINPYFVVSWRTPTRPDHEIRSKVIWNGNVNIQYPNDINATQVARVVADLSFTFQGWIFQQSEEIENIYTFNTNYINAGAVPFDDITSLSMNQLSSLDTVSYDNIIYTVVPPKPKFIEPTYAKKNVIQKLAVWGSGFEYVTNVYLSGAPVSNNSTLQNPFSATTDLSGNFPAFLGVKLSPELWTSDKYENSVTITTAPSSLIDSAGLLDIIVENPRGYGALSQNVPINTFNPFASGTPSFNSWVYVQLPYLSGLQVF